MVKTHTDKLTLCSKVVFSAYSWRLIKAYFGWGVSGPWNKNEQICALGGRFTGSAIRAETALPMLSSSASPGCVEIKAETWFRVVWALEDIGMVLVGSVHSHPNSLPVFLSGEDLQTHMRMFPNGASVVLNPQRREIAAFDKNRNKLDVRLENPRRSAEAAGITDQNQSSEAGRITCHGRVEDAKCPKKITQKTDMDRNMRHASNAETLYPVNMNAQVGEARSTVRKGKPDETVHYSAAGRAGPGFDPDGGTRRGGWFGYVRPDNRSAGPRRGA